MYLDRLVTLTFYLYRVDNLIDLYFSCIFYLRLLIYKKGMSNDMNKTTVTYSLATEIEADKVGEYFENKKKFFSPSCVNP
jgi:hypothetical protein